ncbi:MAG: hypothetical protein AB7V32_06945, partial [Candidatus Berkiella sp.]
MNFTRNFIDSLIDQDEINNIKLLNSLHVSTSKSEYDNSESLALESEIKRIINKSKIAPMLENLKFNNRNYKFILNNVFDTSAEDLGQMIQALEELSAPKLKSLISKLKLFKVKLENYNQKISPKGLYGCLTAVNAMCSNSTTVEPSMPYQHALLTGVVMPIFNLFKDLEEENADLTTSSIPKLEYAKAKMLEALRRFSTVQEQALQNELDKFDEHTNRFIAEQVDKQNQMTAKLVEKLAQLQQSCQSLSLTPDEKSKIEHEIKEIDSQIKKIDTAQMQRSISEYHEMKRNKLVKQRATEEKALKEFFQSVDEELTFIRRSIGALAQKRIIEQQYQGATKRSELRKRKHEIEALKEATGRHYLLSDNHATKKFVNKHGGKLLYNLSQGKLAAMGRSDGLCGGYSAEFLEVCSIDEFKDLTFKQKMDKFKSILACKQSFALDQSADITRNDLTIQLESALRWDVQNEPQYGKGAVLFEIQSDDKSHASHKRTKQNARAFYQRFVTGIIDQCNSRESARLMLWFFDKQQGHAVALNYDKDGFLFHDSNTGYIHFSDKSKFATFLADYFYLNYPELTEWAKVFDYDVVRDNVSKYKFKLQSDDSVTVLGALEQALIKQQSQMLEKTMAIKEKVKTLDRSLKAIEAHTHQEQPTEPQETQEKEKLISDNVAQRQKSL